MMGLIGRIVPVADEKNNLSWGRVARDFAHNTLFSFAVGPFINGMSSAINHTGFWKGVKEVVTTQRGWKCNAELSIAVGVIATLVNSLMGRNSTKAEAPRDSLAMIAPPMAQGETTPRIDHSAREESRREQAADARISR